MNSTRSSAPVSQILFRASFFRNLKKLVVTDTRSNKRRIFKMTEEQAVTWAEHTRSNGHRVAFLAMY